MTPRPTTRLSKRDAVEQATKSIVLVKDFASRLNMLLDGAQYAKVAKPRATRLAKEHQVSVTTARKWLLGEALPSPVILIAIAHAHGVSIDWLLTGAGSMNPTTLVATPLYRMAGPGGEKTTGGFEQIATYYRERNAIPRHEQEFHALILSWAEARDPAVTLGDIFFVNTSVTSLKENAIYLVRSPASTSVRRIRVSLEGTATVSRVSATNDREESVFNLADIAFNSHHDINAIATLPLLIVGRVVGILSRQ